MPEKLSENEIIIAELDRAKRERLRQEEEWYKRQLEHEKEFERVKQIMNRDLSDCVPATRDDYVPWLQGYIMGGGQISHCYDYDFPYGHIEGDRIAMWLLAKRNFSLPTLYGAYSKHIIVKSGVNVTIPNSMGHSTLYFMDGFRLLGHFVPCYADVAAILEGEK
jgi:hypothetical protein